VSGQDGQNLSESASAAETQNDSSGCGSLVQSLKDELRTKEEYLQTVIEELETSNEELKSSNEEMQSVNEELQSTNEELETSKEELQSVNEELSTVNNELSTKIADLSRANNDMNNLLSGTGIATVFVNHQLQILRFTPTASVLINLIQSDIGRPVNHILTNLSGYNSLQSDIESVLASLIPKTTEVQTKKGDWYRMNILPYRTLDNVIEGAVINFVDITESRKLQKELENQLSEKIILFKESHHRMKNNISSIEGFLALQANSTAAPEVKAALKDSISRLRSMRVLYDKLLLSNNYRNVSIKVYIESLIDSLFDVFSMDRNITVEKQIPEFTIAAEKAVSIGMIINELMTNVFKYAFKDCDSCTVFISIEKNKNTAILTIQDNGVGIIDREKSTAPPGFGLTIVKMLVQQLKCTYSTTNDNGTKSVIKFEL
jgi:two-component sensor histidine kinase